MKDGMLIKIESSFIKVFILFALISAIPFILGFVAGKGYAEEISVVVEKDVDNSVVVTEHTELVDGRLVHYILIKHKDHKDH